jgi:hypothetical protein
MARMGTSILDGLESRAALGAAALVMVACSGASGSGAPPTADSASAASPGQPATNAGVAPSAPAVPEAIHGDWHEDQEASTEDRQVFVPRSVNLGPAHYRRTLSFGRDGSFSTLILDPADAHYECKGVVVVLAPNKLEGRCPNPKTGSELKIAIQILQASKDRLEVQMTP